MLCGQHVLVQTNNMTVMYYLNKAVGTRSKSQNHLAQDLTLGIFGQQISLMAVHLAGADNVEAVYIDGNGGSALLRH